MSSSKNRNKRPPGQVRQSQVVTIFGPTHPQWTEIYYPKERQVAVKVFCGPCQKKVCPLDHRCMIRATPDMVYGAAVELLEKPAKSTTLPIIS